MANAEDLNRLTSCSLVLLSHVFLSIGNSKESMNMVTPAMQLASKIPDIHVQLWGSAILKDLHRMSKDVVHEKEAYANHVKYSENLIADQMKCVQSIHHSLIDWLTGPPPATGNAVAAITAGPSNSTTVAVTNQTLPAAPPPTQIITQNPQMLQQTPTAQVLPPQIPITPVNLPLQHSVVQTPQQQQQPPQSLPHIVNPNPPATPLHHIPPAQQTVIQQIHQPVIASTSTHHQQHLQQQQPQIIAHQPQILMQAQQQQPPQLQHQHHQLPTQPPQVIINQPQQTVQYIHQPIGPQVQQQQFGQYY